jgi:3-isopropylmalate/(R)-2-methylmalate dehydratase large subunit
MMDCCLLLHAGGKTEDFLAAAQLFHRAQRQVQVPTYLVPATQKVRT